ncbi:MAG: radical SAM protein [Flavobacteriales bacterium]
MKISQAIRGANARIFPQHLYYDPEWIVLGVNNVCNLHCKMCDVGLGNENTVFAQNLVGTKPLNMPMELVSKIITQSASQFPKTKIGYAFTEPLVYPHLIESIELATRLNVFTSVTSNALTLPQKAEDLARVGLKEIYISLDGPEDVHNETRGNAKSFQKAVEGIEKLASFTNAPKVSVFCVITEWNIGRLTEFLEYFRNYQIEHIGFMHMNFTPEELAIEHNQFYGDRYFATASNIGEINVDAMDLNMLFDEICEIKKTTFPFKVSFSPEIDSREDLDKFYLEPKVKFGKRCNDVFRNIMIKSDGSVIPAHGRCFNLRIGNIYEQDLKSIWNSSVIAQFRKTLNDAGGLLPACNRCCSAF